MKLLLVEDEPKVASFIKQGLEEEGYEVDMAYDGQIGKSLGERNSYPLAILDVNIPYINGIELCKILKNVRPQTKILMLTALGTTDDKVLGFESGADDYLVKPFEFKELVVRLKALLRRNDEVVSSKNQLKVADLTLDLDKKMAIRAEKPISLTAKEYTLLEYLMRNKGRVVSRIDITEHVWDLNFDPGTNVVEVYINILRKKIDKDSSNKLIQTKIGMGYMISEG